nr:Fanconi anemia group M protein [Leptinotarsa decemlineata]
MSNQLNQSIYLNLSRDPESEGFDLQAGQSWIYPTNYPVRDYQYNIIQKALLKNTLVSLPTGLGKTFIAAVVMYNYFRWYPQGKVVFMAPTRPLVKQQVDACYDIMAIPKEVTAELTGSQVSNSRKDIWDEKRVFFITPQILQNDLDKFQDLGTKIKCVVFDEAHRAKGNHAYCEVIRKLVATNKYFRVLALSATPGGTINDVLEVVRNLLISHLEFRIEESLDVSPYVFQRNLTTVVVPLGEKLQEVKDKYLKVLDYYTRSLVKYKVIPGNYLNLTKGKIFMTMREFQAKSKSSSSNYSEITKCLTVCITLYHALELLVRHGLRSFLNFFEEHIDKPILTDKKGVYEIMQDLREYLGPPLSLELMPDGSYPELPKDVKFGHPKFYKLRDILLEHFKETDGTSRVIVFFEYRDSTKEAYALLLQSRPILKPRIFLGHSKGVTQRQQINVVKSFREGTCNILLSTSIGEEGLDVGEVDLIICFDISNKSPIRMVQRMGRTGRKKKGKIVVLVTEGKEQQTLKDCLIHKNNVASHVLSSRELAKGLIETCPRLVPANISPKCEKMFITVRKPVLKRNSSLKDMFRAVSSSSSEPSFTPDLEIVDIQERIPPSTMLFNKENPLAKDSPFSTIFSKRIEKQRSFQEIYKVQHSKSSEILVGLLQLADSKRFNIPMSQMGMVSQVNSILKQTDIRTMFFKSQSDNDFVIPSSQAPQIMLPTIEEKSTFGSRELFTELSNVLSIEMTNITKPCKLCPKQIDCSKSKIVPRPPVSLNWIELDDCVFSSVTLEDLKSFTKSFDKTDEEFDFEDTIDFSRVTTPKPEAIELEDLIDQSILTDIFEKSCSFQAPKTLNNLLNKYSTSIIDVEPATQRKTQETEIKGKPEDVAKHKKTPDLFEDTFRQGDSIEELLSFFKLKSLDEIFDVGVDPGSSQATIIYSPDIFMESPVLGSRNSDRASTPPVVEIISSDEGSPIIGTFHVKKRSKKPASNLEVSKLNVENMTGVDSPSNFSLNTTKLCSTPKIMRHNIEVTRKRLESCLTPTSRVENGYFKSGDAKIPENSCTPGSSTASTSNPTPKIEIDDLCDFSFFGLSTAKIDEEVFITPQQKDNSKSSPSFSEVIKLSDSYGLSDFCEMSVIENLPSNPRNNALLTRTNPEPVQNTQKPCSPSQVSITQMISLVNREDAVSRTKKSSESSCSVNKGDVSKYKKSTSQKENNHVSNILDDSEVFNFSFNSKKPAPKKTRKLSSVTRKAPPKSSDISSLEIEAEKSIESLASNQSQSDDEFEKPSSPVWVRPKPLKAPRANYNKRTGTVSSRNDRVKEVVQKRKCEFIDNEAELSFCEETNVSGDEEEEMGDCYDASFVADETYHVDTQMHAKYLQSVRSPVLPNRFRLPKNRHINVYSQEVREEEDTYLDDSFVVNEETIASQKELSQLEILEKELEMQRKRRKNGKDIANPKKRRRIIVNSDSE